MIIAAYMDNGYKLMLFLHILSVIVAFAPAFVWPIVSVQLKKAGKPVGPTIGAWLPGTRPRCTGLPWSSPASSASASSA